MPPDARLSKEGVFPSGLHVEVGRRGSRAAGVPSSPPRSTAGGLDRLRRPCARSRSRDRRRFLREPSNFTTTEARGTRVSELDVRIAAFAWLKENGAANGLLDIHGWRQFSLTFKSFNLHCVGAVPIDKSFSQVTLSVGTRRQAGVAIL